MADHPARLFVCARCHAQVLLCSHCDRGQRYCGRACSRAARRRSQCEAAQRYQRSRGGRIAHAARSRRWRMRQRSQRSCEDQAAANACDHNNVTHQGSPAADGDASLAACEREATHIAPAAATGAGDRATPSGTTPARAASRCRRCARTLLPWVRQGFLRHGLARWPARVRDHSP